MHQTKYYNQKQKHRPMKDNAYRQDLMSVYQIMRMVLITVNNNHAQYFPQTLRPIVYALQNFDRNFANLVAPPTDGSDLRTVQSVTKYIPSRNRCRKQRPNRCIIGDAIIPQTGTKLTKKRGSKFGALLWRHLTPQRKTATQVHNYSPSCIQRLKFFWENLLPVGLSVRTNLFIPSSFWTTYTNCDNFAVCAIQRHVEKCLYYRCTSTLSALKYCGGIFFKSLSYLHEVVRTNFSADFWTFRNF